uniref:BTB domain-containing protein n=1 Tax=Panagrolaimus davidi TaxID=227884 RepID=A0A914PPL7_9BILA
MSSNAALTQLVTHKKFFKWTIPNFNEFDVLNMKEELLWNDYHYVIESPLMTAIDPYDSKQYTGTFKIYSLNRQTFIYRPDFEGSPETWHFYFTINDDPKEFSTNIIFPWTDDIKKLTIYADLIVHRSFFVQSFAKKPQKNLANRLTEIWKNDSSVKYTIKCGDTSFDTYKPFLAANSFFFKDMFESTTENFVEINEFEVETVQKMIEFCETDNIKDVNGCESDLFKIAHKFQIPDLMEFAVEKMSENANTSNIFGYLQLAINYKLKDFEEWCMKFAFPSKV